MSVLYINSAAELQALNDYQPQPPDYQYPERIVIGSIDFTGVTEWEPVSPGWAPMYFDNATFSNLTLNKPGENVSLFGNIGLEETQGELHVVNFNLTGDDVYGLAASCWGWDGGTTLNNWSFSGELHGTDDVAGLFGNLSPGSLVVNNFSCVGLLSAGGEYGSASGFAYNVYCSGGSFTNCHLGPGLQLIGTECAGISGNANMGDVTIQDCSFSGPITCEKGGGLFGTVYCSVMDNCHFTGTVNFLSTEYTKSFGGLASMLAANELKNCHAEVDLLPIQSSHCAGLVGTCFVDSAHDCFFEGDLLGGSYTGGLFGHLGTYDGSVPSIENCYVVGNISGTVMDGEGARCIGGLIGNTDSSSSLLNCNFTGAIVGTSELGGLFGRSSGATLTNCTVTGNITGIAANVGGLIGLSRAPSFTNCNFSGELTGSSYIGGLTGQSEGFGTLGDTLNCYTEGSINVLSNATSYGFGGLFGSYSGSILDCSSAVNINTHTNCTAVGGLVGRFTGGVVKRSFHPDVRILCLVYGGGLIGECSATTIEQCWAKSEVFGEHAIGGLIGYLDYETEDGIVLKDSYAVSSLVQGQDSVGGLVGSFWDDSLIAFINCYAVAPVVCTGSLACGGLIGSTGLEYMTVTSCYYDVTISGQSDNDGRGVPLATLAMKTQTSFIGWDFETVWAVNSSVNQGYPYLLSAIPTRPTIELLNVENGGLYNAPITPDAIITNANEVIVTLVKLNNEIIPDYTLGTVLDKNGTYQLTVTAIGAMEQVTVEVSFDLTIVPEITILGVEDGVVYAEPVTPDALFAYTDSYTVSLTRDGEPMAFNLKDELTSSYNYVLTVRATNTIDHTVVTAFSVNIRPIVSITGIEDGITYTDIIRPDATITDAEETTVILTRNDKWLDKYELRDRLARNGEYVLEVAAKNGHNQDVEIVSFTIAIADEYTPIEPPEITKDTGDPIVVTNPLLKAFRGVHRFKNFQLLDTGYRAHNTDSKKRYRECQIKLNNVAQKQQKFYTEFYIDGDTRKSFMKYNLQHNTEQGDTEYGLITIEPEWVDPTVVPGATSLASTSDDLNAWTLDISTFPERSLWKVRIPVSGKGYAPRLLLLSVSEEAYELLSTIWVARKLNSR